METNMNATVNKELFEAGRKLLESAYEFWKIHQKLAGPRAVVWLENESGGYVLFTRGEYKTQIIQNISPLAGEIPLTEETFVRQR